MSYLMPKPSLQKKSIGIIKLIAEGGEGGGIREFITFPMVLVCK